MIATMKCTDHPTYKAIRKPQCACEACWRIWLSKNKPPLDAKQIVARTDEIVREKYRAVGCHGNEYQLRSQQVIAAIEAFTEALNRLL